MRSHPHPTAPDEQQRRVRQRLGIVGSSSQLAHGLGDETASADGNAVERQSTYSAQAAHQLRMAHRAFANESLSRTLDISSADWSFPDISDEVRTSATVPQRWYSQHLVPAMGVRSFGSDYENHAGIVPSYLGASGTSTAHGPTTMPAFGATPDMQAGSPSRDNHNNSTNGNGSRPLLPSLQHVNAAQSRPSWGHGETASEREDTKPGSQANGQHG